LNTHTHTHTHTHLCTHRHTHSQTNAHTHFHAIDYRTSSSIMHEVAESNTKLKGVKQLTELGAKGEVACRNTHTHIHTHTNTHTHTLSHTHTHIQRKRMTGKDTHTERDSRKTLICLCIYFSNNL